jgi:hypothetical protein
LSSFIAQYILDVENGRIRWFHRNENGTTVFSILTDLPVLSPGKWSQVAVSYDGLRGSSQIYIDGKLNKEEVADPGVFLSRDWSKYAGKISCSTSERHIVATTFVSVDFLSRVDTRRAIVSETVVLKWCLQFKLQGALYLFFFNSETKV